MSLLKLACIATLFAAACSTTSTAPAAPATPATPAPAKAEPANGDAVTQCPKEVSIDCMPIVRPENARYCAPANRTWIEAHCPSIGFTD